MRWEDERYVRLYTRDTVGWRMLPWQAKALLPLLMRKVDRAGILDLGEHGISGLSILTDLPLEVVQVGFDALAKSRTVTLRDSTLLIPNFLEAQEAHASDAQRKRDQRERARAKQSLAVINGEAQPSPGVVYFVRALSGGPVKIGHTTIPLADRLAAIQNGHPEKLSVIFIEPGTLEREAELHRLFAATRRQGEWFDWSPEIARHVTQRDNGHAESQPVTPIRSVPSRADPSLAEHMPSDARARVGEFDHRQLQDVWLRLTGNILMHGAVDLEMLLVELARTKHVDASSLIEPAVRAFVDFVNACNPGRRPAKSAPKFVQHWSAIQEIMNGTRDPAEKPNGTGMGDVRAPVEKTRKEVL